MCSICMGKETLNNPFITLECYCPEKDKQHIPCLLNFRTYGTMKDMPNGMIEAEVCCSSCGQSVTLKLAKPRMENKFKNLLLGLIWRGPLIYYLGISLFLYCSGSLGTQENEKAVFLSNCTSFALFHFLAYFDFGLYQLYKLPIVIFPVLIPSIFLKTFLVKNYVLILLWLTIW